MVSMLGLLLATISRCESSQTWSQQWFPSLSVPWSFAFQAFSSSPLVSFSLNYPADREMFSFRSENSQVLQSLLRLESPTSGEMVYRASFPHLFTGSLYSLIPAPSRLSSQCHPHDPFCPLPPLFLLKKGRPLRYQPSLAPKLQQDWAHWDQTSSPVRRKGCKGRQQSEPAPISMARGPTWWPSCTSATDI